MSQVNQLISKILHSSNPSETIELVNSVALSELTEVNQCIDIAQVALEVSAINKTVQLSARALEIEPQNQALYTNLVTAHMFKKDSQSALSVCEKFIDKFGNNPVIYSLMGNAYSAIGDFERSEINYKKALEGENKLLPAIQGLAKSKKFNQEDAIEAIDNFQQALEQTPHPQGKAQINYSIAKLYNDIGFFEAAWNQATQANELVNHFGSEQQQHFSNNINSMISGYSSEVSKSSSKAEHVLIVGMPRSGTTLLENIITNNSNYFAGGEAPSLDYAYKMMRNSQVKPAQLNNEDLDIAANAYTNYYQEFGAIRDSQSIVNKLPINFMNLGYFKQIFPKGKIIYAKRDYRDVIASTFMENFSEGNNYTTSIENIIFMIKQSQKIMDFWVKTLDSILQVDYQELVNNEAECKKSIAEFLNVDTTSFAPTSNEKDNVETPSLWQVRQPIYKSSVGRFKNYEALKDLPDSIE